MQARRIVTLGIGVVAGMAAFGLLVGGSALLLLHATQRDGDGYYTAPAERLATPTAAITAEDVDLDADVHEGRWAPEVSIGTVRIAAAALDGRPVFVGIARRADVARYLAGVDHDTVTGFAEPPVRAPGGRSVPAAAPASKSIWVASASGPGAQSVQWDIEPGRWAVVLMNADGSPGVAVDATVGIRTGFLFPVAVGLVVAGVLAAVVAAVAFLRFNRQGGTS